MAKRKKGGARHPIPKPRLAVIGGVVGSGLVLAGETGAVPYNLRENIKAKTGGKALAADLAAATSDWGTAVAVLAPAVVGAAVSVGASKLGINKALARAKAPFRI